MAEELHFVVTGEFITKHSRDLFWAERRPYSLVMELIFACMCIPDDVKDQLSEISLRNLAEGVLLGKYKFVGSSADDSFGLVEDDTDILELYGNVDYLRTVTDIELVFSARKRMGDPSEEPEIDAEYGWLSPTGEFYPVEWANHQEWAREFLDRNGMYHEFYECYKTSSSGLTYGDYLVYQRGWILLHSPGQEAAFETRDMSRRRTKAQADFLYDYYMKRRRYEEANKLFEEEVH